jgi:hypothetical protein
VTYRNKYGNTQSDANSRDLRNGGAVAPGHRTRSLRRASSSRISTTVTPKRSLQRRIRFETIFYKLQYLHHRPLSAPANSSHSANIDVAPRDFPRDLVLNASLVLLCTTLIASVLGILIPRILVHSTRLQSWEPRPMSDYGFSAIPRAIFGQARDTSVICA